MCKPLIYKLGEVTEGILARSSVKYSHCFTMAWPHVTTAVTSTKQASLEIVRPDGINLHEIVSRALDCWLGTVGFKRRLLMDPCISNLLYSLKTFTSTLSGSKWASFLQPPRSPVQQLANIIESGL